LGCVEKPHTFKSQNYELSAFLHIPKNMKAPITILLHGFTGNKIESNRLYVDLARTLCNSGIAVLRFDYRGHGDSPCSFEDFRIVWAYEDAEAAIKHVIEELSDKVDSKRIGLVGLSLGGAVAIRSSVKFKSVIKALVLLSPAINFSEIIKAEELSSDNYVYLGPQRIRKESIKELAQVNLMNMADKINAPTLIIHSKDDNVVPYEQSVKFHDKLTCKKKLILLEEGGHVFSTYNSRALVIQEVRDWLKMNLTS